MATRPKICWSDLAGSAVGVWGLGVEGGANLRRLGALGVTPVLVDDAPAGEAVGGLAVLPTDRGGLEALAGCEVVVKTPGISRYRPEVAVLEGAGVVIAGGLGLWLEEADRSRVACITGTKGKSTTTAVAGHLLAGLGYRCLVGGNIGRLPYDPEITGRAAGTGGYDFTVVEVSSFQATDLASSPPVVAVTSLHPDHLDWHGTAETYYRDKLSACTQPGAALTVADGSSDLLRARRGLLSPEVRWVDTGDPDLEGNWVGALGLAGRHNHRNALIARACIEALGVPVTERSLATAAAGFSGLPSRLRQIGRIGGVTFVDDSLSTNVLPTLAALDAFAGRSLAVIVGGHDRGIDYRPLAERLATRLVEEAEPTLVLTLPANGPRIHRALDAAAADRTGGPAGRDQVVDCPDLATAVTAGYFWARDGGGGVVLLSPAAPSFGQFRDYQERSAAFDAAMRTCGRPEQTEQTG